MTRIPHRHTRRLVAITTSLALTLAACGSDDESVESASTLADTEASSAETTAESAAATTGSTASTDSTEPASAPTTDTPDTTAPGTTPPDTIPPGTKLVIGDQGGALEIPLRLSGALDDLPYEVEFASFASGPLVNEAFAAGAIDVGMMGDTPALLSYAQGLDTIVVGIRASDGVAQTLVARPDSGIDSLDDLAGKKVAWTTGTNQHGFVLRALDSVGLTQDDVEQVDVPLTDVANVLAADQADAAVLYEVFRPPYIDTHPGATELVTLQDFTLSYIYLLGRRTVVEDPAKSAAIEDFVGRLASSGQWVDEHPDEWIQAYYVEQQKQTPEYGRQAHEAQGYTEWVEVGGEALAAQQEQADLFFEAGFLPEQVDLAPQFDPSLTTRFTDAITEALQ